jgi:CubicO group peptidase (beta-lactamase class C family)
MKKPPFLAHPIFLGLVTALIIFSTPLLSMATSTVPFSLTSMTFFDQEITARGDLYLSQLTKDSLFSGSVLVARDGEILLSHGYGEADRTQHLLNTAQTKFRLGSLTKQFTAMAILILQGRGALNVRDRICTHMADCPVPWQSITIHQLLTHTSGIPDFARFPDYQATMGLPSSPTETIARFKDKPLEFLPGEKFSYSNSGYILLGAIIEQASGIPYEAFLRDAIFTPLQMANSGYDHNTGDRNFRVYFVTQNGQVIQMRAGRLPEVSWSEGCL